MEVQKIVDNFKNITSTPVNLGELRKIILLLAMKGKLVRQDSNEEPALNLIKRVHALKNVDSKGIEKIEKSEEPFNLPNGWAWTRLAEIGTWRSGSGFPISYQGRNDLPYLFCKVSDMNLRGNEQYIYSTRNTVDNETAKKIGANIHPIGTVIFPKIGGAIATNKRRILAKQSAIDNNCLGISSEGYCSSEWLYFLLMSMDFTNFQTGTSVPSINQNTLGKIIIALPPLAEQNRIVSKIEELMMFCDQLERQQERGIELQQKINFVLVTKIIKSEGNKDLVAAWDKYADNFANLLTTEISVDTIIEMLRTLAVLGKLAVNTSIEEDSQRIVRESLSAKKNLLASKSITKRTLLPPLSLDEISQSHPSRWSVARFEDLANVSGGVTKGRKFKGRKTSNHPYLRVANVQRGYFLLEDIQEIEILVDEFEKYVLKDGDILITEGGDWDKVGRTAIWKNQIPGCLHQNHVFKARLYTEKIKKEWIELVFNSSVGREYWESASKQTTNLASINMTQVRSFPVPVPSLEEQELILDQLGKLLSLCDDLKRNIGKLTEVQEKFAKAAIYDILYNESGRRIMATEETTTTEDYKRQISVTVALVENLKVDLSHTNLASILGKNDGRLEAKELWKASGIKEIDDFYAFLKQEIEAGFIQQPQPAEIKITEMIE